MKHFILISVFLMGLNTFASGIIRINGKVISFSKEQVTIETKANQYTIDRNLLSKSDSASITKANQVVSLSVPMSSVKRVKSN